MKSLPLRALPYPFRHVKTWINQKNWTTAYLKNKEKLGCQNFNSRSVKGLESRFESILLAYSVLLSRAQRRFEGTLRYSLGY